MRDGADDQQADDGALQEDDEQLPDVERKLGAKDQAADLRMAGVSISVKPTIIVEATAFASGT